MLKRREGVIGDEEEKKIKYEWRLKKTSHMQERIE